MLSYRDMCMAYRHIFSSMRSIGVNIIACGVDHGLESVPTEMLYNLLSDPHAPPNSPCWNERYVLYENVMYKGSPYRTSVSLSR